LWLSLIRRRLGRKDEGEEDMTRFKGVATATAGMAALVLSGCSHDGDNGLVGANPTNRPPVVQSITISPEVVPAGGTATITIQISDPDGDAVACSWASAAGQVTPVAGQACQALYRNTMDRDGVDRLTVIVSDSNCAPVTISHEIPVGPSLVTTNPDNPNHPQRTPPTPAPPTPGSDPNPTPTPNPSPTPGPTPSPSPSPTPRPNLIPRITGDVSLDLLPLALGTINLDVQDDDLSDARCEFRVNATGANPLAVQAVTCGPLFSVRLQALLLAPLGEDCVFKVTDKHGASAEHHVKVRVLATLLP
jgi:hypothetical protein